MRMPDGSTQPLTDLHVRVTEYTVGALGDEAMPGELPAGSAYTYAADYTVDEAVEAGRHRASSSTSRSSSTPRTSSASLSAPRSRSGSTTATSRSGSPRTTAAS